MLFYFSATGNSQYVAKRIAAATDDTVLSIADCMARGTLAFTLSPGERLGLVSPTYAWGLPSIVADFLAKVAFHFSDKPYVYYVATYGMMAGAPQRFADSYLAAKGCPINASFNVKMPDNWTVLFDLSDQEEVAQINRQAETRIDSAIEGIRARTLGNYMQDTMPLFAAKLYYSLAYGGMRKTKHLHVLSTCVGCGLCAKNCPVNAIEMKGGKPVWVKEQCAMCLGCLHRCPKFSIQYDNRTQKHGQYQHPNNASKD